MTPCGNYGVHPSPLDCWLRVGPRTLSYCEPVTVTPGLVPLFHELFTIIPAWSCSGTNREGGAWLKLSLPQSSAALGYAEKVGLRASGPQLLKHPGLQHTAGDIPILTDPGGCTKAVPLSRWSRSM